VYRLQGLMSIGITSVAIGDLLFKTNKLHTQANFEKFINVYSSSKLLENIHTSLQVGYFVFEQPNSSVYPFLGLGVNIFLIDKGIRLQTLSGEAGIGIDYFIPTTPFLMGLQASYSHAFNLRAPEYVSNNQGGFTLRAQMSVFIMNRYSAIGWD
jgi:hypothetical protein